VSEVQPLFVGGTGRSGTHIVGRLLGSSAGLADVPIEARFHCNKRGMPDLIEGRVSLGGFLEKLRGFWWHRIRVDDQPRGLYTLLRKSDFDAAAERFEASYRNDPLPACATLFRDLLWRIADEEGKPGLVEMSSHNVKEAQTLRRIFPGLRMVHTVRDGRDAASSVTTKTWGPDDVVRGIEWWAQRIRAIQIGVEGVEDGAEYRMPPGSFHVVVLDDLVSGEREERYAELVGFTGVDPGDSGMRSFFDAEMSAETMNRGRWAKGAGALGRARVRRRYERTLAALEEEGNHVAKPLIEAYERLG
jgi:hypothetical protein